MGYELTEDQNVIIISLAKYMKLTAWVIIAVGLFVLLDALSEGLYVSMLFSLVIIAIGLAFYFPVGNLERIAEKEGTSIEELMQAFSDLNRGWTLVIGALLIAAIVSIINSLLYLL
ncbi:MAG: hypothetical protein ACFFD4_11475 [Candidatus Odinarchaeota archaeon]